MQYNVTVWQRAVLFILIAWERTVREYWTGHDEGIKTLMTRKALENAMLFKWQPYHSQKMGELIDLGWVEMDTTVHGLIAYRLTEVAHVVMDGQWSAMALQTQVIVDDSGQLRLPGFEDTPF